MLGAARGGAVTQVSLAQRIARCRDELEASHPDAHPQAFTTRAAAAPGLDRDGGGGTPTARLEDVREELRRRKLTFLAVEAQLRFVEGSSTGAIMPGGADMEERRREARARNKALKAELAREQTQHAELCRQLAEGLRESAEKHEECEDAAKELQRLVEEEEMQQDREEAAQEAAAAISATARRGVAAAGEQALAGATRASTLLTEGASQDLQKRRRVEEEEARQSAAQRRACAAEKAELERLEALERARVERLELLAQKEAELGLPRIRFNDAAGQVVIEGKGNSRPELHTVRTARDAQTGRLVRAEPHPCLGLEAESAACVEGDDLARLLTLVWHRSSHLHGAAEGGA